MIVQISALRHVDEKRVEIEWMLASDLQGVGGSLLGCIRLRRRRRFPAGRTKCGDGDAEHYEGAACRTARREKVPHVRSPGFSLQKIDTFYS